VTAPADERDPLDEIAEDFLQKRRSGTYPSITEYVSRLPGRAEEVRDLLSALVMVEELKPDPDATVGHRSPDARAGPASVPDQVGEFRIIREIGRGGMGIVYEAEQESLGRRVALKVLYPRSAHSAVQVRRFLREARLAARLHHTNIVQVFGVGNSDNLHYYSMQFIKGLGLDKVMDDLRRLDVPGLPAVLGRSPAPPSSGSSPTDVSLSLAGDGPLRDLDAEPDDRQAVLPGPAPAEVAGDSQRRYMHSVARIGVQTAEALEYAHKLGTLHRDIKPSNLLLDAHGTVWVTDFGLAKALEDENLTESRDLIGTLRYMSPERFRGQADARSDVYALGLTLYEMIALRPAFEARDRPGLVYQISHVEPVPLHRLNPAVPRDLETIISKAIEKSPSDRYHTASALASDLRRFLEDRPIEARAVSASERIVRWARRNPGVAALAGTVMVLLALLAVGATIAAVQLDIKHRFAVSSLEQALRAQDDARRRLWESLLDHARAVRRSGSIGQRFDGLRAIGEASALGVHLDRAVALRDEAVACLALVDLKSDWSHKLPDAVDDAAVAVDRTFERYVRPDSDGALLMHRCRSNDLILRLPPIGQIPASIRFSADGRFLGVSYVGESPEFVVWDLRTSQPRIREIRGVQGAAFDINPAGNILATGHRDGTVRLHDLETLAEAKEIPVGAVPHALSFDPSGRQLAVASLVDDAAIQVIDLSASDPRPQLRHAVAGGAYAIAWHPDGQRLCVGGTSNRVHLLRADKELSVVRTFSGHYGAVVALAIHPAGELLASGSWDGTVRLWDLRTGRQLLQGPLPDATYLSFSADGRLLGPGRDGVDFWSWEVAAGGQCRSLVASSPHVQQTWSIDFRDSGDLLISTGPSGARLDSPERGEPLAVIPLVWNSSAIFEPDGQHLLTSGRNGLERWPIRSDGSERARKLILGPPRPVGMPPGLPIERICISADGQTLAVVVDHERGRMAVVDMCGQSPVLTFGNHPGAERLSLSPDATRLATGTWKGSGVKIWNTRDGTLERTISEQGSCDVVFSPDGRLLLTGSSAVYRCWDVSSGSMLYEIPRRHAGGQPGKGAFSPDGSLIAIAPTRSLVQLIEAGTGHPLVSLEPPDPRHIASMGFSPDGSRLAVTFNDETILLWDLRAIRGALAELHLDWNAPEPANAASRDKNSTPPDLTIEIQPHPGDALVALADRLVAAGDIAGAAARYAEAIEAGRFTPTSGLALAILRLETGDEEGYRALCEKLLNQFGGDLPPEVCNTISWTCAIGKNAVADYGAAIELAERSVASQPSSNRLNTLGAALYRAGRYNEAFDRLQQAVARHGSGGTADDWVFLAMTEEMRGNHAQAQGWLRRIDEAIIADDAQMRTQGRAPWRQRLGLKLLHAEARELIESRHSTAARSEPVQSSP
jgi:serine/threonine protein kinase/WD40 repeat protein/tetratricopeptide (TPR) repeat protein